MLPSQAPTEQEEEDETMQEEEKRPKSAPARSLHCRPTELDEDEEMLQLDIIRLGSAEGSVRVRYSYVSSYGRLF